MSLGEELWVRFFPKFITASGGSLGMVGAFGSAKDLLECLYVYAGGRFTQRVGQRRSLTIYTLIFMLGGMAMLLPGPLWIPIVGALVASAWSSLSLPVSFAMLGHYIPRPLLTWAFAFQSIIRRIPIVIGPIVGGWMLHRWGFVRGVEWGVIISVVLALVGLLVISRWIPQNPHGPSNNETPPAPLRLSRELRQLLTSDVLGRFGEGLCRNIAVIHVTTALGMSAAFFGTLIGIQMATSILLYIPIGYWSRGREPWPLVIATFIMFAMFPLALAQATTSLGLVVAFIVAGLREIGEPARKSLITSLVPVGRESAGVGHYYLWRGLSTVPAPFIGASLYSLWGAKSFYVAALVAGLGVVFALGLKRGVTTPKHV